MKQVYGWAVDWNESYVPLDYLRAQTFHTETNKPRVTIDLFFSSRQAFHKLYPGDGHKETLVKVWVDESFADLDFIPDNY